MLSEDGVTGSYANDDIGVHRIENRSNQPAYTLHVYAPGLKKMKIFKESGEVSVFTVGAIPYMSEGGTLTGQWGEDTNPDGVLDIAAWNTAQEGHFPHSASVSPALSAVSSSAAHNDPKPLSLDASTSNAGDQVVGGAA